MSRLAILIIGLGFVLRLFCFHYTAIINPDGALYIHQARAIYYGLNDSLTSCSLSFFSNYAIFIAGAYAVLRDWVIAAKAVSLIFGTMTLIPVYFLLKRFFDDRISLLTTLIFAIMPVFIDRSVDVVRAPIFWFFSALGLYLFVSQIDNKRNLYLLLGSLSFLMATWARIEAILYIVVSGVYMLAVKREKKLEGLIIFVLPVAILASVAISGLVIKFSELNIFRYKTIISYVRSSVADYESIRASLQDLIGHSPDSIPRRFLLLARGLTWWVALGTLIRSTVETFFYPFFLVFVIGLRGIWGKAKQDRCILYLSLVSVSALLFLYMVVLILWEMPTRYIGIFILPALIFVGFGLQKVLLFFKSRFNLKESIAFALVCLLMLVFALPKNLKPRETDKLVFKRIGELIAEREGNDREIMVATSQHSIRWISFYANANFQGAPCPEKNCDLEGMVGNSYEEFVENLRRRGIRYFLWEENHWPKLSAQYISSQNPGDFVRVGEWSHADTGRLILFKVI